jgi:DNA-binding transcriptional regulator YhcF (GntR family)
MKFDNNIPIYWQIIEIIKQRIMNQELKPGEMSPSVRAMSLEFKVTTNTIQRALIELVREGLLIPFKGIGYRVTDDQKRIDKLRRNYSEEKLDKVFEDLKKIGITKEDFHALMQSYLEQLEEKE